MKMKLVFLHIEECYAAPGALKNMNKKLSWNEACVLGPLISGLN